MPDELFDAVVVGSGFGGAVMAYRLAEAGLKVLVLERGKSYPPNSFPRDPRDLSKNFWDPSNGLYGMYNLWSFRGSGAIVSSGLGGGSLVYANVLIRKPEKWFVYEDPDSGSYTPWAVTLADMVKHYERVERMMGAQLYPGDVAPYSGTPKMLAFEEAARTMNHPLTPLPLAVSFRRKPDPNAPDNPPIIGAPIDEPYENLHRMPRTTCRLCGECDLGCNFGSKNTLDFNYLSAAARLGAEIRTLCEVKEMAPDAPHGYTVRYLRHEPENYAGRKRNTSDRSLLKTVRSKYLILSAGSLGTTFLLLKNQGAFPALSAELGKRYSTNGDMLSFLVKATQRENGQRVPRNLAPYFGTAITRGFTIGADDPVGFLIEEWGNPYFISWIVELSGVFGFLRRLLRFAKLYVAYQLGFGLNADISSAISAIFGESVTSLSSIPTIAMGQEPPAGTFSLVDGKHLDLVWRESKPFYARLTAHLREVADALGAEYKESPTLRLYFHQFFSAHPLGGCSMGLSKQQGVVSAGGEVFDYPGLYVADGSVLPGPAGVNPALTIAALADRFADHLLDSR
jgi:cholesterol oxidase